MRTISDLKLYQQKAVVFQCTRRESMLWLDMGLGKTVVTLTAIQHLLAQGFLRGVLIVAPVRVVRLVWRQEAAKWNHTKDLTFSLVVGDRDQRTRALLKKADVYLMNYENLMWLAGVIDTYFTKKNKPPPFNGLVWDEISKCKNSATQRVKGVKKIFSQFDWVTGLTGTPASNGYKDLHGQYLVVDGGKRLGVSKTEFKHRFYHKKSAYVETPYPDTEDTIKRLVSDITLEMSAADYNPLPPLMINDIEVELPDSIRAKYTEIEKDFFMVLDSSTEVEIFNKATLMNKCLQFASGIVYPIPGLSSFEELHEEKLLALDDLIDEMQGNPLLLAYDFTANAQRIMARYKHLNPINLTECKTEVSLENAMYCWKSGKCPLMIGHPASMGHGVDGLQARGNHLVWFGLTWSLDYWLQFCARPRRQGTQHKTVICHRILCKDTVDYLQDIALGDKEKTQVDLRVAVKQYRTERGL